jgi:hypothetical protein
MRGYTAFSAYVSADDLPLILALRAFPLPFSWEEET